MTNQTTSAIVTPPQIIRAKTLVPNGKETDSSIHYDEFHPVTDADIIWFVNYLKNPEVAAILGTDTVQKAIEKLDKKDDYIEGKVDAAQRTANTAREEAQAAQTTADTAINKASAAQQAAEDAQNIIEVSHSYNGIHFVKFKNRVALQTWYDGEIGAENDWVDVDLPVSYPVASDYTVVGIPAWNEPSPVAVKDFQSSSFKFKGARGAMFIAWGYMDSFS